MKRLICLITVSFFLVPTTALAQVEDDSVTIYDFPEDNIDGTTPGSNIGMIYGTPTGSQMNLITLRTDFMSELFESVESL